jgi:tetratricopeptide (TPR) repeat protein
MADATPALQAALQARHAGHWADAHEHLRVAASLDPANYLVPLLAGNFHEQQADRDAAAAAYEQATRLAPQRAETHFNLGNARWRLDRHHLAESSFRRALELRPNYDAAWRNLSFVLREQGRAFDAWQAFLPVLRNAPQDPRVVRHFGQLALETGQTQVARQAFEFALQLAPSSPEAHVNYATLLFHSGELASAWDHYAWRWQAPTAAPLLAESLLPTCNDFPGSDARLLVIGEQGLGDEIMFASCYAELIARVQRVVLLCEPRLAPLFARAFPQAQVIPRAEAADLAPLVRSHDLTHQVLAGTVCGWFRSSLATFAYSEPFLCAAPEQITSWRTRLAALSTRPKVGIAWRGGAPGIEQRLRSTDRSLWLPLLAHDRVDFVNLQYGATPDELEFLCAAAPGRFHHFAEADPLHSLDASAALLASLDLVIGVTQTGLHLAGALGVPTWNVLRYACDWRWFQCFPDISPWYPSMRLLRQLTPGDWHSVFDRLDADLHVWASQHALQR